MEQPFVLLSMLVSFFGGMGVMWVWDIEGIRGKRGEPP